MKRVFYVFTMVLFVALGFIACDKNDNGGNTGTATDIIGTWVTTAVDGYVSYGGEKDVTKESYNAKDEKGKYVFNEDGTFQAKSNGGFGEDGKGKWTYASGKLTLKWDSGNDEVLTVKSLNTSTVVLEINYTEGGSKIYYLVTCTKIK